MICDRRQAGKVRPGGSRDHRDDADGRDQCTRRDQSQCPPLFRGRNAKALFRFGFTDHNVEDMAAGIARLALSDERADIGHERSNPSDLRPPGDRVFGAGAMPPKVVRSPSEPARWSDWVRTYAAVAARIEL